VRLVRALENCHVLVVEGEHVRRDGKALEVLRAERRVGVGRDEGSAGVAPGASIEQGTCGL
jgi:hypothetical protein